MTFLGSMALHGLSGALLPTPFFRGRRYGALRRAMVVAADLVEISHVLLRSLRRRLALGRLRA